MRPLRCFSEVIRGRENGMLKWALVFALIAIVASVLGFSGVAAGAAGISKFLLLLFVLLAVVVIAGLVFGIRAFRKT